MSLQVIIAVVGKWESQNESWLNLRRHAGERKESGRAVEQEELTTRRDGWIYRSVHHSRTWMSPLSRNDISSFFLGKLSLFLLITESKRKSPDKFCGLPPTTKVLIKSLIAFFMGHHAIFKINYQQPQRPVRWPNFDHSQPKRMVSRNFRLDRRCLALSLSTVPVAPVRSQPETCLFTKYMTRIDNKSHSIGLDLSNLCPLRWTWLGDMTLRKKLGGIMSWVRAGVGTKRRLFDWLMVMGARWTKGNYTENNL